MKLKREKSNMLIPTIFMGVLALVLSGVAYVQGKHLTGLKSAGAMLLEILPLIIFAFIIAGMVQVLVPEEMIAGWLGKKSGMRGILMGTLAGGLCPGGPYVSFPLVIVLLRSGAGIPTMVAFLTSWSLWAVSRLAMEVGMLGWRFVLIRLLCVFFFPPLAGLIATFVVKIL